MRNAFLQVEHFACGRAYASGNFSLPTNLPLDGSADGSHTVALRATDRAGNVCQCETANAVVLDQSRPTARITRVELSSPSQSVTQTGN